MGRQQVAQSSNNQVEQRQICCCWQELVQLVVTLCGGSATGLPGFCLQDMAVQCSNNLSLSACGAHVACRCWIPGSTDVLPQALSDTQLC
jgi:hypothetical protein